MLASLMADAATNPPRHHSVRRKRQCTPKGGVFLVRYWSPLSPWPAFTFRFAFFLRSCESDRPTSSLSLNSPFELRRTYRLSVPVSISSRFAAFFFAAFFFFFAIGILLERSDRT